MLQLPIKQAEWRLAETIQHMASLKAILFFFLAFNPPISWPLPCILLIPALVSSLSHRPPLKCCSVIWQTTTRVCARASGEVIITPCVKRAPTPGPSRAHAASGDRPYLGRQPFPLPAWLRAPGSSWAGCRHHRGTRELRSLPGLRAPHGPELL